MNFERELDFEAALIQKLYTDGGWEPEVLRYQTEEDLIQNWANILFENNRDIDRLNDAPLTRGEMQQILEEIARLLDGGALTEISLNHARELLKEKSEKNIVI